MSKIIIPENKVWGYNSDRTEPELRRFEVGNESGIGVSPPDNSDHNFQMHRSDSNVRAILREGVTEYDEQEYYTENGLFKLGNEIRMTTEGGLNAVGDIRIITTAILDVLFPVDSKIHGGAANPATRGFPGVWSKIASAQFLIASDGDWPSTSIQSGNNAVTVPVPAHSHTMEHNHTGSSHTHTFSATTNNTGAHTHGVYDDTGSSGSNRGPNSDSDLSNIGAQTSSAGAHSHTVSGTTGSAGTGVTGGSSEESTGNTGETGPTVDVRGARSSSIIWLRVS